MAIHKIHDNYLIYKGRKVAELKYRKELSAQLIDKFGSGPYEQKVITEIITFCLAYYIARFEAICKEEKSYTFYKYIFWFHEQASEAMYKNLIDDSLAEEISGSYIASYRRILKFIIEIGCEVEMISGEKCNKKFINRFERILDDLLFLGEMIMLCVDLYAEQRMIEDVAEISFDKNNLYIFSRKHHYDFIFEHISSEYCLQTTKHIVDPKGFSDFENALECCFGLKYKDVSHLLAVIQQELKLEHGETVAVGWETFILNMNGLFSVSEEIAEQFFGGLRLNLDNKMSLLDLACKPYNLNRFIYRPIVIWKVDGKELGVFGSNSWAEAITQLTTNAFAWGKAPKEWMLNECFRNYVYRKEDEHDKWLDDAVEEKLNSIGLMYDRNVISIKTKNAIYNIDVEGLGEIDFIIIAPSVNKIFISDCKHLLGRYDIVNQKNDFNAFTVGSKKTKPYNQTLANKLQWFNTNIKLLEEHFQVKYANLQLSFDNLDIEGIFIVNSPTFYMYNSDYRIYTIDQITDVFLGTYVDPTFKIIIEDDEYDKILNIKYPFFKKPTYITYDPWSNEDYREK